MIKGRKKLNEDWGISGYECKRVIIKNLDKKAPGWPIVKDSGRPKDFISTLQK